MDMSDTKNLDNRLRVISTAAVNVATNPVVLGALVMAIVILAAWSVMNVTGGVVMLGLYPEGIPEWAVYGFVTAIQTPVTLFSVLLPLFFSRLIWTSWFTPVKLMALLVSFSAIVFFFVAFETVHQIALQTKNAMGKDLLVQERIDIDRLHLSIDGAAATVQLLYKAKVAAYKQLAVEAEAGRDDTGIAKCGPNCKKNRRKESEAIGMFNDLEIASVPPKLETTDLLAAFSNIQARAGTLESLNDRLKAFYLKMDGASPPPSVSDVIASVKLTTANKVKRYAGMTSISEKSLALEATKDALVNLSAGKAVNVLSAMAVAYGCAPFLASLALGICISLIFQHRVLASSGIAALDAEVAAEEVNAGLLDRLKTSRMASFRDAIKAKFHDWRNLKK